MADLIKLKTEITTDPLVRGYAAMTSQQVATDLNTEYRTRNRTSVSGDEVFKSVASRADWDALALVAGKQQLFVSFCARDSIDPFAPANEEFVKSIFGNASQTVANLAALRVESVSRAEELGIGFVTPGEVEYVRNN